jgi:hypothetical protein
MRRTLDPSQGSTTSAVADVEQQQHLTVMLRGFYQYFALHHCDRRLSWIRHETQRQWKQLPHWAIC